MQNLRPTWHAGPIFSSGTTFMGETSTMYDVDLVVWKMVIVVRFEIVVKLWKE